jgi:quercetin dioxygenase-like cupin family protein
MEGHTWPRHDHPSVQVIVVLQGRFSIVTDDEEQYLDEADTAYIPRGRAPCRQESSE